LIEKKEFSSARGSEEVKSTWIKKSNSFIAFCYDFIEGDSESQISKKDLRKQYSDYCKKHKIGSKSDFVIKRTLQDNFGVVEERLNPHGVGTYHEWFWLGIKWKRLSRK